MPVAATLVLFTVLAWTHRWTAEDGFINFRVVEQLLHGHGFVYNAGERVEAVTSPLWIALLAVGHAIVPGRLEWLAAGLSIVLAVAGIGAASAAATALARRHGAAGPLIPVGALAFVAFPPAWEFATSGLEPALALAWLGGAYLVVVRAAGGELSRRGALLAGVAVGIGPLIRPDLAIFSVVLGAVLLVAAARSSTGRAALALASAVALPVAYEVFRVAYFAALEPNTAFAKEAGQSNWSQGVHYAANLVRPYALWIPLGAAIVVIAVGVRGGFRAGRWLDAAIGAAPVAAALVYALYVVRLGGDFMHARLLVPAVFATLLPVMAMALPREKAIRVAGGVVVVWAAVCLVALRPPLAEPRWGIVDERALSLLTSHEPHPVTVDNYSREPAYREALRVRALAASGRHVLTFVGVPPPLRGGFADMPAPVHAPARVYAATGNIGVLGYKSPRSVWVVDQLGLADPVGSRLLLEKRGRPGHEKIMPAVWMVARFGVPASLSPQVAAARAVLRCRASSTGSVAGLLGAIEPGRQASFITKLRVAFATRGLRVNPDPLIAHRDLCGGR